MADVLAKRKREGQITQTINQKHMKQRRSSQKARNSNDADESTLLILLW